ncbi:MAG: hypothetical protein ACYCQL_01380 [Acidithiobacillus sp.]
MYESEDSWAEQSQGPSPEQDPPDKEHQEHETAFTQGEPLTVPADQEKSGTAKKAKKGIPKWQWGVLAGFGVVAVGGGAAFALLGGRPEPQVIPAQFPPPRQAASLPGQQRPTVRPPVQTVDPKSGMTAGTTGGPVPAAGPVSTNGFATLNALSGAVQNPPPVNVGASSTIAPSVSGAAESANTASALQSAAAAPMSSTSPVALAASPADLPTVALLKKQIAHSKAEIARLQKALQTEKAAASKAAATEQNAYVPPPRVITRTIVRYVHVPVAAASPVGPVRHQEHVQQPSTGLNGWRIVGGDAHTAMLSGPGGQVRPVRTGDVLPGGELVQQVTLGEVVTSDGVIR